jgi:2-polyprenyl-3-methyl-5-hydroxy-6-metoxy-1,4-benzoquinol methylase
VAYGRSVRASPGAGVVSLYDGAPAAVRAHVRVRWATCPMRAVAAAVPPAGRVLEVGCGHGLLSNHLALESGARHVLGIDVDRPKIDAGNAAARRGGQEGRCRFEVSPPGDLPDGPWDCIAIVDVLYLLPADVQRDLLRSCAAGLGPGGMLVVKEMAPTPRWKAAWNRCQEALAVRLLGITVGEGRFTFVPPEELAAWMAGDGLVAGHRPLHRGYPHPHHLVVGRKDAAAARHPDDARPRLPGLHRVPALPDGPAGHMLGQPPGAPRSSSTAGRARSGAPRD